MKRIAIALAGTAIGLGLATPASAQDRRPDTLETIGVGARATGLGGAFVSVADDVTATFWNPAGLTKILERQLALDLRQLPKSDLDLRPGVGSSDFGATAPQFSFAGVSFPLGGRGALAFSRALVGYSQTSTRQSIAGGSLRGEEIARYWYNTIAYGRDVPRVPGDLRLGLAAHWVQVNALVDSRATGVPPASLEGSGDGFTFSFGALYQPAGWKRWNLGLNYLHPTSISGLDDVSPTFGDRVAGRVSGGASYTLSETAKRRILASGEIRHYFGTDSSGVAEDRDSTTDYHFGAEYRLAQGANWWYLRSGFFTRNSPNDAIFFDDRIATVGVGYERTDRYRADVAVEISTETGEPMVTTSLRYSLGPVFTGRRQSASASSQKSDKSKGSK